MSVLARLFERRGRTRLSSCTDYRGKRVKLLVTERSYSRGRDCDDLSLELDVIRNVAPEQDLYTKQGVAVTVEHSRRSRSVRHQSIWTAAEQFLTKTDQETRGLIKLVMEGHLRGIIGQPHGGRKS